MARLLLAAVALSASACAVTGAGDQGSSGQTIDPNASYVAEQDPAKAQEIAKRMWGVLTAPPCWIMHNSTDNYSFSGVNDYRYAGYETTAGQVGLNSTGGFGGHDAADVNIAYGEYWIVIYDANTITISFLHDGSLATNSYTAAAPGEYCV